MQLLTLFFHLRNGTVYGLRGIKNPEQIINFAARRSKMKKTTKLSALAGVLIFLVLVVFGPAMAKKYDSGKAWIGVYTQTIDDDLEEAFDLDRSEGVVIVDVVDDSPADDAGLRRKDIIVEINGKSLEDSDDLVDFVSDLNAGDEANLVIIRKGEKQTIEIEVGERPKYEWFGSRSGTSYKMPKIITRDFNFSFESGGYMGVAIQNLSDQLGEYFGVEDGEGILVTEVFEDSPAEEAGLKAGDVIIAIDDEDVAETDELQEIIAEKEEGDEVTVEFFRNGNKQTATVEIVEDEHGLHGFSIPDIDIDIPNIPNLKHLDHFYFSDDDDHEYFEVKEYRQEMEQLKQELKAMSRELKEIKKKLD